MSVIPLRYGAGVMEGIVEAMNHGVPVVTTSIGGEEIPNANTGLILQDEVITMVGVGIQRKSQHPVMLLKLQFMPQGIAKRR
jgi:glycosyltransferase involved in cell wall biosynthesis